MAINPRIMLVEASKKDADQIIHLLQQVDYNVEWLNSVSTAADRLAEQRFDACLLGCHGSSEQMLSTLQGMLYTVAQSPLLMLIPQEDPDLVERSLRMGAIDVLVKGLPAEQLSRSIRYAVARYHVNWRQESVLLRDSLTALPNFIAFQRQLHTALENAKKVKEYEVGVMHLGVDGFKLVNSGLGHSAGDALLVEIARRLSNCLRDHDVVARRSGDEFSIVLTGLGITSSIDAITKRIQRIFEQPFMIANQEVFSSVSIGISLTDGKETAEALLHEADIALHRAKRKGRGCYEVFLRTMQEDAQERLKLENDLRRSVAQRNFILYYQPIVSLETGEVAYFEALVRWDHPEKGILTPWFFLSLAEETGLIVPIGWQLLHQACRQVAQWSEMGLPVAVSVNLSAAQFCAPELLGQLKFCLELSNIDNLQLKLEITESSLIENQKRAKELLEQIGELGLQVYLDDFGTGYSSLAYLERFPLHGLKIDRAFVMEVINSPRRGAILKKIIELGQILDMQVVAEGVESFDELNALKSMCCDMVQGYYYAKPMPAAEVPQFLEKLAIDQSIEVDSSV